VDSFNKNKVTIHPPVKAVTVTIYHMEKFILKSSNVNETWGRLGSDRSLTFTRFHEQVPHAGWRTRTKASRPRKSLAAGPPTLGQGNTSSQVSISSGVQEMK
jgi:hypothetical protein